MIPHPNRITPDEHIDFAQYHLLEAERMVERASDGTGMGYTAREKAYERAGTHAAIAEVHVSLARWKAGR